MTGQLLRARATVTVTAGGSNAVFACGRAGLYLVRAIHIRRSAGASAASNSCFLAGDAACTTERCMQFTYAPSSAVYNVPAAGAALQTPVYTADGNMHLYFPGTLSGDTLVSTLVLEFVGDVVLK